ncbi:MAG: hypothetical protein OXH04_17535 [Acidobacteria bacterium]|nr:hypothetical protein [Acidobacteriota bacterium]
MREVEDCIAAALCSKSVADVRDGLSNVLFWGHARHGARDFRVRTFRSNMISADGRLVRFQEFVRSRPEQCAADRLVELKKLRLPAFGQMSFATKILMFLDPEYYPVLDLKIARAFAAAEFPPLQGLTFGTSVPITKANAIRYERWACWCRRIATRVNREAGQALRTADVERALFALADAEQADNARDLLLGPSTTRPTG